MELQLIPEKQQKDYQIIIKLLLLEITIAFFSLLKIPKTLLKKISFIY